MNYSKYNLLLVKGRSNPVAGILFRNIYSCSANPVPSITGIQHYGRHKWIGDTCSGCSLTRDRLNQELDTLRAEIRRQNAKGNKERQRQPGLDRG